MNYTYIGIDIAKDDFVVAQGNSELKPVTYPNSNKGISKFIKTLPADAWCTMEATGVYSVRLSSELHEQGINVSVINPLQIKRFAQTKLKRTKTDFVDAQLIAEYGDTMKPEPFSPIPPVSS
ncbi:transposase [Ekhidna sp.]|uniref:IS110 family transposase n=1 Tax=Ekhidna sp. TaxID=2608089 RepID=UPI00329A2A64